MTEPQPAPLQPPAGSAAALTLTAPAPPQPVAPTAAPRMAPAVEAAALPGLDAKVDAYLESLMAAAPRSPEFAAKATDVRTMGDVDIRKAAETSNRLLTSPVKALQEGGLAEGSKVGATLLELRRTIEDLDPKEATGARKLLGLVPFGDKVTDYFRKYQSAQTHLDGILHALQGRPGRARQGQRRAQPREAVPLGRDGPAQPVRLRRRAARRAPRRGHRRAGGHRPRQGQGAARRRPVLRPAEAPGPADPAGGLDPELPRHRHRHQEQHRADQGCRPRVDDHGVGAAHRGHRGPGARATRSSCSTRSRPSTRRRAG